jgi:hypothetical protein
MSNSYRTNLPYEAKNVIGSEMYDYEKDPLEKASIIDNPGYKQDQLKMEKLFAESMQREYKSCVEYGKLADFKAPILVGSDTKKGKKGKAKSKD